MENLVEGWTAPIPYEILTDGAPLNLTGMTVAIRLYDASNNLLTLGGSLAVTNAALGQVAYSPGVGELLNSRAPYKVRFPVTDGAGKIAVFPEAEPERWNVRLP